MKKFVPDENKIIKISCGFDYSIALSQNFTIFAWGSSDFGVLATDDNIEPVKMDQLLFENNKIISISSGLSIEFSFF